MGLKPSTNHFEAILKEPLVSFYNGETYSNIPKLKVHLESEWEKLRKKGIKNVEIEKEKEKKRKSEEESEIEAKRLKEI